MERTSPVRWITLVLVAVGVFWRMALIARTIFTDDGTIGVWSNGVRLPFAFIWGPASNDPMLLPSPPIGCVLDMCTVGSSSCALPVVGHASEVDAVVFGEGPALDTARYFYALLLPCKLHRTADTTISLPSLCFSFRVV